MYLKILPSFIVIVLAGCLLQYSALLTGNNTAAKKNPAGKQQQYACPAASANDKNNAGAVHQAISSYPSIIYVDM